MKIKAAFFLALFMGCAFLARAQGEPKPETRIRVLLAKEAKGVLFESRGGYKIFHPKGEFITHGTLGKRFVLHAISNGLRWGEEFPGIYALSIYPIDDKTHFYVDGMQYKGAIHVYATKKGFINVVNEVPVEEFVTSTLAVQIEAKLSKEALAALAIAERTNVFAKVFNRDPASLWDVNAQEMNYVGVGVTQSAFGVDEAVFSTKNIVLEEKPGLPFSHVSLKVDQAEALASKGLDAKRILRKALPGSEIGTTVHLKKEMR